MTDIDGLHRRGQALEDEYFRRVDADLVEKMRSQSERKEQMTELVKATGLHDETLFDHLLDAGLNASNIAALALTPLVFVAWADGAVAANERQTIISAALRQGVNGNPLAFNLLEQWLLTRPPRELWRLWKEYAREFHNALPPSTADKLAKRMLQQCTEVANASGGVLGIGKVSDAEQKILDEVIETLPERSAQ